MELVGTAVSTILVGLLTMWATVGGAAGLVVWLPSENLELHPYEGFNASPNGARRHKMKPSKNGISRINRTRASYVNADPTRLFLC